MKHEEETGTPSDAISREESSLLEESSSSKDTTPPTVVRVFLGKRKGIKALGDISKPSVKKPTVPNSYQKKRVGIGKFVVPKLTTIPPKPAHGQWTVGTPSHGRIGRRGTYQTPTGTKRTTNIPPPPTEELESPN